MEESGALRKLDLLLPLNDDQKCIEEAEKIVLVLRSDWEKDGLQFEFFTEGISNRILSVWDEKTGSDDRILIRIYGEKTELVIDRHEEMENMNLLVNSGCAPPVFCEFSNGLIYKYIPGEVLDVNTVKEKRIVKAVAKTLVKQHLIKDPNNKEPVPCIFQKAKKYIQNMPSFFHDHKKQQRFVEVFPPKDEIFEQLERIKQVVEPLNSPVVFCHNDLLLKNIVYNAETDSASFIDYEYAGFNYQAFDIADHFAEFPAYVV